MGPVRTALAVHCVRRPEGPVGSQFRCTSVHEGSRAEDDAVAVARGFACPIPLRRVRNEGQCPEEIEEHPREGKGGGVEETGSTARKREEEKFRTTTQKAWVPHGGATTTGIPKNHDIFHKPLNPISAKTGH